MAYQEWVLGPPLFDGNDYQMWHRRMSAFLRGKGKIIWDVMKNTSYVRPINFYAPGSSNMHDTNNKVVDYLFCTHCKPEFDWVCSEDLACKIWERLKVAHGGNNQVKARLFATYHMVYENFTHIPGDSIDSRF
jgi:hypothetical protein